MNEYEILDPKKVGRKITWLTIGLVAVLVLVVVIFYQTQVSRPASLESRPSDITVARGATVRQVANTLEEKRVINHPYVFIIYVYLHSAQNKIQAGEYMVNGNMAITEIVDILTNGKVASSDRKVTIIEGLSNKQIGNLLFGRKIISKPDELDQVLSEDNFGFKFEDLGKKFSYEGFLFPDTYVLTREGKADELISKMLNNFENKLTDQMLSDIEKNNHTLSEVLILASIIEKEVGRNKKIITQEDLKIMQQEREKVASVFYNRLEIGMALESDATVNYITGKSDRSVTIEDIKIKSAYNTYANRGLPPSPISNPGIDSIKAAIYPANTDYLFFLNSPDGTAYFARNLAEHGENREKYLR